MNLADPTVLLAVFLLALFSLIAFALLAVDSIPKGAAMTEEELAKIADMNARVLVCAVEDLNRQTETRAKAPGSVANHCFVMMAQAEAWKKEAQNLREKFNTKFSDGGV